MKKYLKEYFAAFGKWGFIMAALIIGDVICIVQSYNQDFIFPAWGWWLILVFILTISPFIAFRKLRLRLDETQNELDKIKDEHPKIETTVRNQIHDFDIEITNKGEDAEFDAQVEIIRGKNFIFGLPDNYSAYWERTKNDKTEIKKDGKDWLKIASLNITPSLMNYCLHYYEITHFQHSTFPRLASVDSDSWIPGDTRVVQPDIILKVTICANPSIIDGPFVLTYVLTTEGLSEV